MKHRHLFISVVIFLMCGVMCLFSTQDAHAQVPQTKRSEQNSFLKNIRAKKRNNDLQKARQAKGKSNQKNEDKIRIRILNGESKHVFDYGYTLTQTNQINALNIIYNNWGIGLVNHKFKGFIIDQYEDFHNDINELGITAEDLEINIFELNYKFGETISLLFGSIFYAEGAAVHYEYQRNNYISKFVSKEKNPSNEGSGIFYLIDTIQFAIRYSKYELVLGYYDYNLSFKNFECEDSKCLTSLEGQKFSTNPNKTMMLGLGFVF